MITNDQIARKPLKYLREGKQVPELCELFGLSKLKFFSLYKADLIEFVKQLGSEGNARKEIAKIMGISFDSVKKLKKMDENNWRELTPRQKCQIVELSKAGINPKGISSELKIPIDWIYEALKPDILLTFVQTNLQMAIEKFGMDARTLSKIIQEEGYIIPSSSLATRIIQHYGNGDFRFYKPMSEKLKNKLEGEIASDGHIRKNRDTINPAKKIKVLDYKEIVDNIKVIKEAKKLGDIPNIREKYNKMVKGIENVQTTSFEMTKATKETPWNKYIEKCLKEEGYETSLREYEINSKLESQSSVQMQELRDKWYRGETKILPDSYKPNPTNVLHHFEGDGSYNRKSNRVNISTQNFTEVENHKIADLWKQEIGIDVRVYKDHWEGREYFRLWINKNADVEKFFQYLEKADKESLEMAKKIVPHKFPLKFLPPDIRKQVVVKTLTSSSS